MSWNLARGEDFLPGTSLSELKQRMVAEIKAKPRLRFLVAMQRKQGKPIDAIADACGMHRRTVHDILHRFQEKGIGAAQSVKQDGRPPQLTQNQRKRLLQLLEKGNPRAPSRLWTSKEVLALIQREFNVTYTPQHVWRLLVACGFSLQQPRPRHYKSPGKEVHDAFKKKRDASHAITEKKVLSWAAKMKPHTGCSQT